MAVPIATPIQYSPYPERPSSRGPRGGEHGLRRGPAREPIRLEARVAGREPLLVRRAAAQQTVLAHPVSERFADSVREKDEADRLLPKPGSRPAW